MREILFRGKAIDHGWIEWKDFIDDEGHLTRLWCVDVGCKEIVNEYFTPTIHADTIGQYTGLKDKNGRKIFEGDIVKVFYNPNYIGVSKDRVGNFIVVFHDSCFMKRKITKPMSDDAGLYHFIQSDEFEVIGNIYDNPELMVG